MKLKRCSVVLETEFKALASHMPGKHAASGLHPWPMKCDFKTPSFRLLSHQPSPQAEMALPSMCRMRICFAILCLFKAARIIWKPGDSFSREDICRYKVLDDHQQSELQRIPGVFLAEGREDLNMLPVWYPL